MPYDIKNMRAIWRSYPMRLTAFAVAWLGVISYLHILFNFDHDVRQTIRLGYMPVITNLAAPLLDQASSDSDSPIRLKAIKFASFAEMAEALRNNEIEAGFMIAPLSIVLRQQGEDVKVVYIGNRHESTLVARKDLKVRNLKDLVGRTVAVPMRYSGHNLCLLNMIETAGLEDQIRVVEMNPPDMASALASGSLDAYFVGEPFAAQTLKNDLSDLVLYVENVWPGFICNLMLVRQSLIAENPSVVQWLVHGAVRSGVWAKRYRDNAAQIASRYWGQPFELVRYALSTPENRIVYDRYAPVMQEMQQLADLMQKYDLIDSNSISGLLDDRFALSAELDDLTEDVSSILPKR